MVYAFMWAGMIGAADDNVLLSFITRVGKGKMFLGRSFVRLADNLPEAGGKPYAVTRENSLILPL